MPVPFPPKTAADKTVEFPQPQPQYPRFDYLIDDLKREFRIAFPHLVAETVEEPAEFTVDKGTDGRSGTFTATTMRHEGPWTVFRRVMIDIGDNRVLRRREVETCAGSYFLEEL